MTIVRDAQEPSLELLAARVVGLGLAAPLLERAEPGVLHGALDERQWATPKRRVRAAIRRPFALRKVRSSATLGSSGARAAHLFQDPDLDEAVL
jgi:hypothetical protein